MVLTHSPFVATPHSETISEKTKFKSDPAYFADMVEYTDYLVGRLINHLDELGLSENTLVLFTGDNGTHRSLESMLGNRVVKGGKGVTAGRRHPRADVRALAGSRARRARF